MKRVLQWLMFTTPIPEIPRNGRKYGIQVVKVAQREPEPDYLSQ